jgi:hypothetical protein
MRVVVTRDKKGEIRIWNTDRPKDIIPTGSRYFPNLDLQLAGVEGMEISLEMFKLFFGFTPRKGSKTVYVLILARSRECRRMKCSR